MLKIAFVMDPLEEMVLDHDTTFVIMAEACRRGHSVFHVAPSDVGFGPEGAYLLGRPFHMTGAPASPYRVGPFDRLLGSDLHAVLIRTDPPFDQDYLTVTQLLDLLRPVPFIMNRPSGLRDANEKLAALAFPDLCPPTMITADLQAIEQFRNDVGGSIVLKPLDGHGGAGILPVRSGDPEIESRIQMATSGGRRRVVAQQIVPGAEAGDRRVLLLDGEPIGALLRRNDSGGFTHNLATGGTAHPSSVTEQDRAVCRRIASWLHERGLWFVGIDLLAGQLIEINVTSPTCVQEINRFDDIALERRIVDYIESRAAG